MSYCPCYLVRANVSCRPSGTAVEEFDDDHVAQYESERRAYAQALIDFDKTWSKLFTGKPRTEENQDGVTHEQFLRYVPSCVDRVDQWACS